MDTKEFEKLAKNYENLSIGELEEEFRKSLSLSEKGIDASTRGKDKDFWKNMKDAIILGLLKNSDLASATLAMITSEVVTKLTAAGIDLTQFRLAISVFIMLVAKAYWIALEKHSKKTSK